MDGTKVRSEKEQWLTRGIVIRCSDETFLRVLELLHTLPDCYVVFSKSSQNKLIMKEEAF